MAPEDGANSTKTLTLEAYADTIIPGEKRSPDDRSVAGASPGGGAVTAGALELLLMPASGLEPILDGLVEALNEHAREYAATAGRTLDDDVPPFVALEFADRTDLVRRLTAPDHPEKELWFLIAVFCTMAFDSGPHLRTSDALASRHPGLTLMGFEQPDADGLWRFPDFSYRRRLADIHPHTTPSGSPA